jgi:hypothetical protein
MTDEQKIAEAMDKLTPLGLRYLEAHPEQFAAWVVGVVRGKRDA